MPKILFLRRKRAPQTLNACWMIRYVCHADTYARRRTYGRCCRRHSNITTHSSSEGCRVPCHTIALTDTDLRKNGVRICQCLCPLQLISSTDAKLPSTLPPDLPVLFFWGTEDTTSSVVHIQQSRRWIPQLQDVCLEGKGHWLLVESKEFIAEKVLQWLDDSLPKIERKARL
jgi:pimeloyl-ACP methyl ester carboxylesterase